MRLWEKIKTVALTDVAVLVKGLDRDSLERVERVLAEADFGPVALDLAEALEAKLRRGEFRKEDQVRTWLSGQLADRLEVADAGPAPAAAAGPSVIVLFGVNGVGKTTVAAKLAHRLKREGKSVLLVAADTYRAAAGEQLAIWAERIGVPCVSGPPRGDPAAVAFDGLEAAAARQADVVIIDTAGRLHTQADLMEELKKLIRVVARRVPGAPHEALLVLDGTVGQNAIQQGRIFREAFPITGLIMTKLDGTAKGGAVVAVVEDLKIPIRFIGTGEGLGDLEPFDRKRFVERLLTE